MTNPHLGVLAVSRTTVFPSQRSSQNIPTITPLSILDSKCANWAPAAAFWIYDRYHLDQFSTAQLISSLRETLDLYPHWTGEVSFVDDINALDHRYRFRRLQVKHGYSTDPGVTIITAESETSILPLLPDYTVRNVWEASQLPSAAFIPDDPLPPTVTGKSAVFVQLAHFTDAFVIGVKIAHGLSDAHTLAQFMHIWMKIHRNTPITFPPLFDPALLDQAAAGDIDSEAPNDSLLLESSLLPLLRYDYWASANGAHPFMADSIRVPDELDKAKVRPLGKPLPWHEWETAAPVSHYVVHFTGEEVHNMWLQAVGGGLSHTEHHPRLSHLDSLLAFVWILINRARVLADDDKPVHLSTILGMRGRLVPDNFVGSPAIQGGVISNGREATSAENLASIAESIRIVINSFTPNALGALLHDMAYEDTPQREWNGFFGRRHVIFTSWLRLGLYDLELVEGVKPAFASCVMPAVDGVLTMTEGLPLPHDTKTENDAWWNNGVDVSIQLNREVIEALLTDILLQKYSTRLA